MREGAWQTAGPGPLAATRLGQSLSSFQELMLTTLAQCAMVWTRQTAHPTFEVPKAQLARLGPRGWQTARDWAGT
jgi:hypothetical protein